MEHIDEEENDVRGLLRLAGLVLLSTALGACGGGGDLGVARETGASAPDGTPVTSSSSRAGDAGAAGSAEGTDPAAADRPVAGSNAPPGFVQLRGRGPGLHAAMTDGDGSAEPLLLSDPPPGEGWEVVEPDGPTFVQTVCGVQLDPVQPRDAAHRRWGRVERFTYLTSETHLFPGSDGQSLADQAATALEDCAGYGLDEEGKEVPGGAGAYQVDVDPLGGLPEGWVGWTETTVGHDMVRHNALRDVDGGWHWVSVVGYVGARPGVDVLVGALRGSG